MERNACTAPWTNVFNASLRQALPTINGQNLSVQLDIFNLANLLNDKWGRITTQYSDVSLLNYGGLPSGTLVNSQTTMKFDPTTKIFDYDRLESNYQLQLSVRYSF
jgi:hypothetical protein